MSKVDSYILSLRVCEVLHNKVKTIGPEDWSELKKRMEPLIRHMRKTCRPRTSEDREDCAHRLVQSITMYGQDGYKQPGPEATADEHRDQFNRLLHHWVGLVSYYSDRWSFDRWFEVETIWWLLRSRYKAWEAKDAQSH